ncbi:MAG: ABC transporter ATP-binding protein [bacterium]|nr:ABC transporter ATP-binding protein [bacterium]
MANLAIKIEELTKDFGAERGVFDLNLEVAQGEIFGYLGPNGAGKTTTIRVLLDFARPSRGRAEIFGLDHQKESVKIHQRIGYLPGEYELYKNLTGEEFLKFLASLRGGVDWKKVKELAERFNSNLSQPIRTLSHGNKQKLGLIQAFMHEPDLLILDEPTTGLDPLTQHEFFHLLEEAKAKGQTVFLSSHILPEVERSCERVAILRKGKLVALETVKSLKERALRPIEVHFKEKPAQKDFVSLGLQNLNIDGETLTCTVPGDMEKLIQALAKYKVATLVTQEPNLEEIFLKYYGES